MDLFDFLKFYCDELGGQFTLYDGARGFAVVPLHEGRFQTVVVTIRKGPRSGLDHAIFSSKIAELPAGFDAHELLRNCAEFEHARFVLQEQYLSLEASCLPSAPETEVKSILQEIAQLADLYELKITGKDIH